MGRGTGGEKPVPRWFEVAYRSWTGVKFALRLVVGIAILVVLGIGVVKTLIGGDLATKLGLAAGLLLLVSLVPFAARAPRRLIAVLVTLALSIGVAFVVVVRANAPASFCDAHSCIDNFDTGRGFIVQCADGMWSHSGGLQGACSYHGGER